MDVKKMFASLTGVLMLATTVAPMATGAAFYGAELEGAYKYAFEKKITTMSSIDSANMYGKISRVELAKMISNWAEAELGRKADATKVCSFSDENTVGGDLAMYVKKVCQMGLMGEGLSAFRPHDKVTRAEFGTTLSRALWGDKYNEGTPYYAKHLAALKDAGIMKMIETPTQMEIRGYVMLMLQRATASKNAANCADPVVDLACKMGGENCPAACKKAEDVVVKAGDLAVTAEAAANRRILKTGVSDLDTITFKTSENVTISKITLERYGYSKSDSDKIKNIRLEDQDGNVIAEPRTLSKDKVTLYLKKDYRTVDGKFEATIVVETKDAEGTIGFKVVDAESTAKNLNLSNYTPYTYDVVDYVGSLVTVEMKGTNKTYNYEEGKTYEIARVKVAAGDSAILVKGFTLTNNGKVDMKESLNKLVVMADSKEVDAKYSINKDDELVVTFNKDFGVSMNKKVTFILSANFKDFADYGESVEYYVADSADFNAVETKNGTRVQLNIAKANKDNATQYQFNGGKIKLSNVKLGSVDAAQASEGTVIAEGNVSITEPVSKINFTLTVPSVYVEKMSMFVDKEEFEGTDRTTTVTSKVSYGLKVNDGANHDLTAEVVSTDSSKTTFEVKTDADGVLWVATKFVVKSGLEKNLSDLVMYQADGKTKIAGKTLKSGTLKKSAEGTTAFTFKNVSIEKSGKIQFTVDIADDVTAAGSFTIGSFGAELAGARYDNVSKKNVVAGDIAGSIAFSKVTIQPTRAALENNLTKTVQFLKDQTNRKVVFDGTYAAKKGNIELNKFVIEGNNPANAKNKVTFYLFINGNEVANTNTIGQYETFSEVLVKAKESVKVKVEAEVEAYGALEALPSYTLVLKGTDANGNEDTGRGSDTLVAMETKESGTTTLSAGESRNTVLLKMKNQKLAEFTVRPSNADDKDLTLDSFELDFAGSDPAITAKDIRVKVDGVEQDDDSLVYTPNADIKEGIVVEISLKDDYVGTAKLTVKNVNKGTATRTFAKTYKDALVYLKSQKNEGDFTKYTLAVEKAESDVEVKGLKLFKDTDCSAEYVLEGITAADILNDGDTFTITNAATSTTIKCIEYAIDKKPAEKISSKDFSDYFKVGGDARRVFSNK